MIRAILSFLLLGLASADMIRIDHREGTTGNYAPVPLTTVPNYVLTFDANGNPVIGPGGGVGVTDGDKGDITVSGTGAAWAVDPGSITMAKMASLATGKLIGRGTAGTGVPEVITLGPGLALTGTTLDVVSGATGDTVSLDTLPDGQEIRGATVASIIIGAGKGVGETTILAPWDVDGAVDGAPRITMTSGNSPTLAIDSPTVSWGDGIKQVFNPSATTAGLNVGDIAGDPSVLVNGDLWYDSTANELTARINGANVALGAGGPGGGIAAGDSPTWTGAHAFTRAGAASAPTISLTGLPFTGGDATTTKPLVLIEPTGTTSTGWATAGTMLGVNAAAGFTGNLIDAQLNGGSKFNLTSTGNATLKGELFCGNGGAVVGAGLQAWRGAYIGFSQGDSLGPFGLTLTQISTSNLRLGRIPSATPLAQTFTIGEASRPGTDIDMAGANGTIQSGLGTGTGTASSLIFQTPTVAAAGSGVQTYATRMTVNSAGVEITAPLTASGGIVGNTGIIGFTSSDASAVATGKAKGFVVCPYAATISGWSIVVDAGTATVKCWKIASGTAKPTSANSINTAGVAIASGTAIISTTLTDFTSTAVTAGDIFAFDITAVSGVTEVTFQLKLTKS